MVKLKCPNLLDTFRGKSFFWNWLKLNLSNLILNLLGSNFGNKSKNIEEYQESRQLNY
ncbi:hypothetical protein MTo_02457 [Microcystis aeruginosa NIES-1211]|uniref:Uncharacterized protein n=1 Tax=Microcystis aeruginosa NIES-2519 TaxID=2303981 RepID=A0A5A5R3V4_MICAE|nr:hypothetical protein [Microcystis aeruginosa]CCI32185.1 hypothetical protein MICAI_2380051 [Microcystis sp. T1-4]GBL15146.1 hypothetical protein MTo_02457 [Microcystis aeruginosa NIES-1211]GCA70823.1 hypothetical protein MiYa_02358 [Microcystis aeruginosa NIES-2519]GCA83462.1 hypothetical protein MiHa_01426 [Microcystis aeruginosa NIES-2522]GCA87606.1 hypothetical protein MiTa_00940 [Microcystis aeruginosa NIES-4264]